MKAVNVYGYSKLLFDRTFARAGTADHAGGRFCYFNVYGPRAAKGKMASVAYHNHLQIRNGETLKLFGAYGGYEAGMQSRDFVYVGDVVDVNLWFLDNPSASGIFNLGTAVSRSRRLAKRSSTSMARAKSTTFPSPKS